MSERRATGRRGGGIGVVLGLLLVLLLSSLPLFVLPSVDEPEAVRAAPADAVVVLGGGQGERLAMALALLERLPEPPPQLLLSVPYGEPLVRCGTVPDEPAVETRCFAPDPFTTGGEAAAVAEFAAAEGWDRLVVVTSDFHVTRARVLVTRCTERLAPDLTVLWVAADTGPLSLRGIWQVATEWPSLLATPWDHEPVCTGEPAF